MAFAKILVSALMVAAASAAPQISLGLSYPDAIAASTIDEPEDAYPVYNYAYQVASDEKQTYIAANENRDGDNVDGEYSYVDPLGNLVTVTYTAGAMGYTEERKVQPNFVTIRAGNVGAAAASSSLDVSQVIQQIKPAVQNIVSKTTSTASGRQSSSDLVAQIISQLTPFIQNTVSGSLGGSSSTRTTTATRTAPAVQTVRRVVQTAAPVQRTTIVRSSSAAAPAVSNIFGVEGANNVRFNTPEFDFAYDLQK